MIEECRVGTPARSEVFKSGFKQIPYSKIGLQKDAFRKNPIKSFIVK